jgi:hypothetical protein
MGIEPTSEAWEAPILPLNYARSFELPAGPGVRFIHVTLQRVGRRRAQVRRLERLPVASRLKKPRPLFLSDIAALVTILVCRALAN